MFKNKGWVISILFIIFDTIVIYGVFRLALLFRRVLSPLLQKAPLSWEAVIPVAQLGILLIISIFFLQGLYPGYGLTAVKEMEQMGKATTLAFILLSSVSYLNKSYQIFPRSIFPIAWVLAISILPIMRFITRNLLSRTKFYGTPVVVFGEGEWAKDVTRALNRVRRLGWKPYATHSLKVIGHSSPPSNSPQSGGRINSAPILGEARWGKYNSDFIAILASTPDIPLAELIRTLNQHFRKVILIQKANNFGSLWVETRDLDSYLGLEFHYHLLVRRNRWIKRAVDLLGAMFLLIILSPLLVLLSVLIAISSPGPVFYSQERLGKDFRRFRVLKFRSMVLGAEEKLQQLLDKDPIAKAQYDEFHKLEDDPRVTRVGLLLRKFSLDELPQLWNVIKGEMSLSGPRAYMPSELDDMGTYAATILRVPPGMTGWWQVLGRHNTSFQKRLEMDEYYISNWSLWMDSYIILKTIWVVLKGDGA